MQAPSASQGPPQLSQHDMSMRPTNGRSLKLLPLTCFSVSSQYTTCSCPSTKAAAVYCSLAPRCQAREHLLGRPGRPPADDSTQNQVNKPLDACWEAQAGDI